MKTFTKKMEDKGLIEPPKWLSSSICYETRSGSHAYGVSTPTSDIDIVGFCVPPKEIVFPHTAGSIHGFGRQKKEFRNFDPKNSFEDECQLYDLTIFNIVEYFSQCMDNNPNWLETLFTSEDVKITQNKVAKMVLEKRHLFLHKGSFYRFTGFAKSQIHKLKKETMPNLVDEKTGRVLARGSRDDLPTRACKYAYHAVRLLDEAEQILTHRELVLDSNVQKLRAIREGEWTFDDVNSYFSQKEKELQKLYDESDALPHRPDEDALKTLLLECLEEYYGSLEGCINYGDDRWK